MSDPSERACRAALSRAGVRPSDVTRMPSNVILARGALLLNQEKQARQALEHLERGVAAALRDLGTMGELFDLELLSGAPAIRALVRLQGLRQGIEFTSATPYDLRLAELQQEATRVRQ